VPNLTKFQFTDGQDLCKCRNKHLNALIRKLLAGWNSKTFDIIITRRSIGNRR